MKISKIKTRAFKFNGFRIDASFHLSDGVVVRRKIAASPYKIMKVGDAANQIFYGNRAKRVYVQKRENGIPFLSSSDILQADLENVKLASKKYTPCIEQMRLQEGWILISRSGTIGNTAWATKQHAQKLASEDVIRIDPNNILRAGFVYAYLSSSYGHSLLTQGTFGAVIQHIEPDFVASLPIPQFPAKFQEKVDNLIKESARLRDEATASLEKAVSYFNKKYPFPNIGKTFFSKKTNDLKFSWAAYNNNLGVDLFVNSYKSSALKLSSLTTKIFSPPLFKHIYLKYDNGHPFMTGSELTKFNMRYYRWLSPKGVKDINDYIVSSGMLLLYKSGTIDGGILGNTYIVDEELNGCCLSDHVIRICFKENKNALWTFAFLKSNGGVHLLQRLATGTMIPFITSDRLGEIFIPKPDVEYENVAKWVSQYILKISEAKRFENKAVSLIEKEIDGWNA